MQVRLPQLENLVRIRQLKSEPPNRAEFEGMVRAGKNGLQDSRNTALHSDSRFHLAYNAAYALSLAALRWHGYRSENRYTVFQSLPHTLSLPTEQWRVLDQSHRKRNLAEYEGEIDVDPALLDALIEVIEILQIAVGALPQIPDSGG